MKTKIKIASKTKKSHNHKENLPIGKPLIGVARGLVALMCVRKLYFLIN
ncbi:hypothetical protein EV207_11183 [Scopulibacillus darangshiensis]|uniref:Uncharacterized protein n=1 Tax=Scopulibacillus darangshiensis TaxID=442528 RepID=A0A4R2P5N8_9BACL|nr:hypothetical protein EV207_11183 [Scopulibacillus darangshiensis]